MRFIFNHRVRYVDIDYGWRVWRVEGAFGLDIKEEVMITHYVSTFLFFYTNLIPVSTLQPSNLEKLIHLCLQFYKQI